MPITVATGASSDSGTMYRRVSSSTDVSSRAIASHSSPGRSTMPAMRCHVVIGRL